MKTLLVPLTTFMMLDVITTALGLFKGLMESNPIINALYSSLPFPIFVVVFLLIKVGVLGLIYVLYKYTKLDLVLILGIGISLIVFINNVFLIS
ncbi:DUF5658 family protein [Saccharolobus islandicus]|uniref:DUF5658 domain-containing protein n=6 Tax=Saccharolobus islandicus TaxID=43080 RepID=M9U9G4_SACIS|nr:DUF5658 family protein [Sulfolobus islandicus]ACP39105.1 conserved hypothetical SSV1 ORF C-102A membrane-like protein [Sulfolobus islandicus M.14.25]ACP56307.1 conserved hypothetical SSV1 ORF C-102A membrane-like protein [Sulfolobus islandicus M.16.27]ACR42981.1 conserved hypothetical SSV1 ORF C-102A membrane-like protein [Sulfolobus islandicus M.16.4]ADX83658.1 conserved hypothetical SSV1 ORF C-102A membrane-like protein [Sulfolobus islandicus HVE10/4]AGJ63664.1 Hypothetical Protein SiL_22